MLLDLAHDAMKNGSVMRAVYEQPALARQDGLWMLNNKRWGRIGGINGHGYNLTIGKDFLFDEHGYYGLLFDYGSNTVSGAAGSGEYDSYSLGLYAGNKNKPGSITGFVSYGLQANKGTAYLPVLGQTAESGYDSKTLGIGVEYAYDLDYGKPEELWHVSPYARLNFTHYRQKAFREHGAGVFDRSFGSYSDIMPKGSWAYPLTAVRVRAVMAFAWVISVSWLASGSLWKSALLKMNAGPCCRYAVGERAGTILWRLMSGMISAENGRLAAALAGTGLMVDGRSGPGLTWLIIFDFLIIKKTKPLSHLSQCGSGFVA